MEFITHHSTNRASDEAIKLWAFASAQYPENNIHILDIVTTSAIETVSSFALNARRALEVLPNNRKFILSQPRWQWTPLANSELVSDLWDGLNRIIHAQEVKVEFERLPALESVINTGALVVPYIQARTDRKPLSFIDIFSLSYAYLWRCSLNVLVSFYT